MTKIIKFPTEPTKPDRDTNFTVQSLITELLKHDQKSDVRILSKAGPEKDITAIFKSEMAVGLVTIEVE